MSPLGWYALVFSPIVVVALAVVPLALASRCQETWRNALERCGSPRLFLARRGSPRGKAVLNETAVVPSYRKL